MDYYKALRLQEWQVAGLKNFTDFSEKITYINQQNGKGDWYYGDEESLTIYHGYYRDDCHPGADMATHAIVCENAEEYHKEMREFLDCEEFLPEDKPDEGDYVTEDYINFYQYGKKVVTVPEDADDWKPYVKEHMEENEFWPDVWYLSDHGNYLLLPLD